MKSPPLQHHDDVALRPGGGLHPRGGQRDAHRGPRPAPEPCGAPRRRRGRPSATGRASGAGRHDGRRSGRWDADAGRRHGVAVCSLHRRAIGRGRGAQLIGPAEGDRARLPGDVVAARPPPAGPAIAVAQLGSRGRLRALAGQAPAVTRQRGPCPRAARRTPSRRAARAGRLPAYAGYVVGLMRLPRCHRRSGSPTSARHGLEPFQPAREAASRGPRDDHRGRARRQQGDGSRPAMASHGFPATASPTTPRIRSSSSSSPSSAGGGASG